MLYDVVDALLRASERNDSLFDFYERSHSIRHELTKACDRHWGRYEPQAPCYAQVAAAIACAVDFYKEFLTWQQQQVGATQEQQGKAFVKVKSTRRRKRC